LSVLYAGFRGLPLVDAVFFGLKPAVMAIVVKAVLRIGRRALKNASMAFLAAAALVAIFFLEFPFPLIVLTAAGVGLMGGHLWPARFLVIRMQEAAG
jgi:chromate transporter